LTDALLNKLDAIEAEAKDDQDAGEVSFDNTNINILATNVQAAIDEIYSESFGTNTANFVLAGPTTGTGNSSFRALVAADIPSLDANKIGSGTLDVARIPDLDVAKIATGVFDVARIPDLNANKITDGTLDVARIPDLDTAKITTGTFDVARIPTLSADIITTDTFNADRIPSLDADKITTGTFNTDRIPTLEQSKVTNLTTDLAAKVTGPASATDLNFAAFDGTTGKLVADSGFSAGSFAKITIGSVEPTSPAAGDLWFNNDAAVKNLFFYDGTNWIGVNTYQ
jgi:hypothetical protein